MCSTSLLSKVDGVIVISVTEHSPEFIIQKILGVETLPTPSVCKNSYKGYEWKLDTKYYTAAVTLYSVQEPFDFSDDFGDEIQATIFHFDGEKPSSFESVLNWMLSLKEISPEVQLLVCDSCESDEQYKKKILNWCVEKQYELIELNPSEESDDEENGPFSRSKGFGRVIEALQAHTWSNLSMKEDVKPQNTEKEDENAKNNPDGSSASPKPKANASKKMTVDSDEVLEQLVQSVVEKDDPDGESFEALFSKFASMKEKASGLEGEDRKKYAEKITRRMSDSSKSLHDKVVAIAFWKAMGGDEDEIAGLDDE